MWGIHFPTLEAARFGTRLVTSLGRRRVFLPKSMRVLIIGAGGREHALAWRLAGERIVSEVLCAPGNPGIAQIARCVPVETGNPEAMLALAEREHADLTIVGPEAPLAAGVVDAFAAKRRLIVGPSRKAAQLECSKAFAKQFMSRHALPTARYRACRSLDEAAAALSSGEFTYPVVLKIDGLAAGKGVTIAPDRPSADRMLQATFIERSFGDAGEQIVIEEFLEGPEMSFFALSDGQEGIPLGTAMDYKRALDGDEGPNTGGMGAVSPHPGATPALCDAITRTIVNPVIAGMQAEGVEYRGVLYVGLMLTRQGPKVLEFNVRFGDPEAQVLVPRLPGDLVTPLLTSAAAKFDRTQLASSEEPLQIATASVGVVLAAGGYPGPVERGRPISGLEEAMRRPGVMVFHAGTAEHAGELVTSGGRILTVVGSGADFTEAAARAYEAAASIRFEGMHYRRDIGRHGVAVPAECMSATPPESRGNTANVPREQITRAHGQ